MAKDNKNSFLGNSVLFFVEIFFFQGSNISHAASPSSEDLGSSLALCFSLAELFQFIWACFHFDVQKLPKSVPLPCDFGVFPCELTCASIYTYTFIYTHMLAV